MFNTILFLLSLIAAPTWAFPVSTKPAFNWETTKYFYAFGDSYTFVGGTKGYPKFSFIGSALNFSYTPVDLLEDEIQFNVTASDGPTWTEYLTGCFQGRPADCSPHQLWNFAFSGADVEKSLIPLHHNFSVDLVDQVREWATYGSDVVPHPANETLTAFWIGINDTGDTLVNTTLDYKAFWEKEMDALFGAVQTAYDHDLRGAYLFVTVPPLDRSPDHLGTSIAPTYRQNILDYNAALLAHAAAFGRAHADVHVLTFDAHAFFTSVLDSAASYGFTNITGFCECHDPTYFWWNTGHPTSHVHRLLAGAIEKELIRASGR
ncbi:uncharacterized protein BXZ73DRAFT_99136 [Epithele typhae]|uniref:uncharacterized protein n=1 Tax=Epithele typhae TaxID=378194 RepID=UPI002008222C|nr:uncharacterized protein BXZ73DRAFT_99136 [Epithele typhae]KAH9940139.1 hypothetical protein BXZ73DRAFT_99136 [Epithele typhae]